jgi:hypothetical protein
MSHWTEKLRLKGMAEEDVYFAKRDRELIDAMHRRKAADRRLPKAQRDRTVAAS